MLNRLILMKWNKGIYLLIMIFLCNCNSKITEKNDEINVNLRKEIHLLKNQIIDGFVENQPEKILSISTEAFKNTAEEISKTDIYGPNYLIDKGDFLIMDEYYQKNLVKGIQTTISSGESDTHDYFLSIIPSASEIYVSIGYFDVDNIQAGLGLVFVKQKEKWLLHYLNSGILRIAHKDVIDWFEEAQHDYEKGYWCNVVMKLGIVKQLLDKNKLLFKYKEENKIRKKAQEIFENVKGKIILPLEVTEVETNPSIFNVVPRIEGDTLYPLIKYVTKINSQDTILLNQECCSLHKIVSKLYPGIDTNIQRIFYQVFSSTPNNERENFCYSFVKGV